MNQHFKKRKARSSSAPVSPRRAASAASAVAASELVAANDYLHTNSATSSRSPSPPPLSLEPTATKPVPTAEGINLSAALTALQVSLKRELDSFIPPTPVGSPIHARSAKRPRFEFGALLPDPSESKTSGSSARPKASPVPKPRNTAFLSVSKKLQQELERTARPDSSDFALRARKRRQQLSYFAIASAFHRAAHERGLALVPTAQVGE